VQQFILQHRVEFLSIPGWNTCLESRPALFSEIFKVTTFSASGFPTTGLSFISYISRGVYIGRYPPPLHGAKNIKKRKR
jgi:hypothetical protein